MKKLCRVTLESYSVQGVDTPKSALQAPLLNENLCYLPGSDSRYSQMAFNSSSVICVKRFHGMNLGSSRFPRGVVPLRIVLMNWGLVQVPRSPLLVISGALTRSFPGTRLPDNPSPWQTVHISDRYSPYSAVTPTAGDCGRRASWSINDAGIKLPTNDARVRPKGPKPD